MCERIMAHIRASHGTYELVTLHVWMSHGTRVNESWYTCEWVTAHTWGKPGMCQLSRTNSVLRQYVGSLLPGEWMRIMTHSYVYHDFPICVPWLIRMYTQSHQTAKVSHAAYVIESWYTCEWVTAHIWGNYGICEWVVSRINLTLRQYVGFLCEVNAWCMGAMTHPYGHHDSPICEWFVSRIDSVLRQLVGFLLPVECMCATTHSYVHGYSLICVPWLIHIYIQSHQTAKSRWTICAMTHPDVCHDSSRCVPWLIFVCAMTYSYVCYGYFTCIHLSNARHDSFIRVPWLICTRIQRHQSEETQREGILRLYTTSINHICQSRHSYVCLDPFIYVLWLMRIYAMRIYAFDSYTLTHAETSLKDESQCTHRIVVETRQTCAC